MQRQKTQNSKNSGAAARSESEDGEKTEATTLQKNYELLQSMGEDTPEDMKTAVLEAALFSGPLPPPALFEKYDEITPGAADRILVMAEKEQSHRHKWEMEDISNASSANKFGMVIGGIITTGLIAGAMLCAVLGSEIGIGLFLGAGALGLVAKFLSPYVSGQNHNGKSNGVNHVSGQVSRTKETRL